MMETLKALTVAREKHSGQLRKDDQPYIIHSIEATMQIFENEKAKQKYKSMEEKL